MSKNTIVIDGEGVTATFNSTAIADINTITFGVFGEKQEIDLTTIDATAYMVGLLADLQKIEDVVISKKFDPAADLAMSTANAELAITYKIGKATAKTLTLWAQLKNISNATAERAPADGVNNEYTFMVTNLNGSLVETGPAIST